jgi:tape measure domain-containing protein
MDETKTIAWQLIVEAKGIEQNTAAAASSLDRLAASAKAVQETIALVAGAEVVRKYVDLVDAFQEFENKVRLTTDSAEQLAAVEERLRDIADQNRTGLQASAEMYNELSGALTGYGASANQVLSVLNEVEQAIKLSGKTAEDSSGEVTRFALALKSGSVSLRDFTTLYKQIPALAEAIAAGLGTSIDGVKQLANLGQLTTPKVLDALNQSAGELSTRFSVLAPTLKDSFTQIGNELIVMVGSFDKASGVSAAFAADFHTLATVMRDVSDEITAVSNAVKSIGTGGASGLDSLFSKLPPVLQAAIQDVGKFVDALTHVEPRAFEAIGRYLGLIPPAAAAGATALDAQATAAHQMTDAELAGVTAVAAALNDLNGQLAQSAIREHALGIERAGGAANSKAAAAAARDYTTMQEAEVKELQRVQSLLAAGKSLNATQIAQLLDRAKASAAATVANNDEADSIKDTNAATQAYIDTLASMNDVAAQTALKEQALSIERAAGAANAKAGADAARDYLVPAQALLAMQEKIAAQARTQKPFDDDQIKTLTARAVAGGKTALALEQETEALKNRNAEFKAYDDIMTGLNAELAASATKQAALTIAITQGAEAADAYSANAEALATAQEKIDAARKAGLPFEEQHVQDLKDEAKATAAAATAAKEHADAWDQVNNAIQAGKTPQEQAEDQLRQLAVAFGRVQDTLNPQQIEDYYRSIANLKNSVSDSFQAQKQAVDAFANDFTKFLSDGKFDFHSFATSLIQDIAQIVIHMELMRVLKSIPGFGQFFGAGGGDLSLGDLAPGAHGMVVSTGRVLPFAGGGVVSGPTTFGLAGGNTGLMGEAGPEAVMPLARLPGGDLGVRSTTPHIQLINNTGVTASARIRQSQDRTSIILEAAQLGASMAETNMARGMRKGYGTTATAMQSTYALKRRVG